MSAVRILGAAGLVSALLSAASGFLDRPPLLGLASVLMLAANTYALLARRAA